MVAVAIMCINMLNHYAPLLLINSSATLTELGEEYQLSQLMLYLQLQVKGYRVAQIFFGIWLFPLGYLVYHSRLIPKVIGVLLMIGCGVYLLDFIIYFLLPEISRAVTSWLTLPADLGEFSLCLYLLFQGVRAPAKAEPVS
jgi:hypothetical protein